MIGQHWSTLCQHWAKVGKTYEDKESKQHDLAKQQEKQMKNLSNFACQPPFFTQTRRSAGKEVPFRRSTANGVNYDFGRAGSYGNGGKDLFTI